MLLTEVEHEYVGEERSTDSTLCTLELALNLIVKYMVAANSRFVVEALLNHQAHSGAMAPKSKYQSNSEHENMPPRHNSPRP